MQKRRQPDREAAMKSITRLVTFVVLSCAVAALLPSIARADAFDCRRAISKASAKFAQAKMKALQKCEDKVVNNSAPGPCPDSKASGSIATAQGKLRDSVNKGCGGTDRSCGTGGDDVPLAAIGWSGNCPNFESGSCNNAITSCDGINTCLLCVDEAAVDQAIDLYYGNLDLGTTNSDVIKCQRSIGKETAKFFAKKSKALQKCEDQVTQGMIAGPCPDGTAASKIATAESKKRGNICKACGGGDKVCGGTDDLSPAQIGFAANCPNVTVPGGPTCAHAITTVQDIVDCVDCVTEFKADCVNALAVPAQRSYPPECNGGGLTPTPASTATRTATPNPTQTPNATPTTTATATACPDLTGQACPTKVETTSGGDEVDLDTGWTGQAHDGHAPDNGRLTLAVSGCASATHPCGQCSLSGPIDNTEPGKAFNFHRCTGDTSVTCTSNTDCSAAGGTCEFWFGSPLPLIGGGVPVCVTNQVNGAVSGTTNVESGSTATVLKLISRVQNGETVAHPCPQCLGGTCDRGPRAGMACTVNGTSTLFGPVSFDCPPASTGLVGTLPITLDLRTSTQTRTLDNNSPNCRAIGFQSDKCMCDTCGGGPNNGQPCGTASECPGGSCGGRRCQGGTNNGAVCSVNSECPSGACGVPGIASAPNQCDDGVCSPNPSDTDSIDEGVCEAGPVDQFCSPTETFLSCIADTDCTFPGDTCSGNKPRECYADNGAMGGEVQVGGVADPSCGNVARPTLGALFCIAATTSTSVNNATGLPGLGRVTLPAVANLNPTGATPTATATAHATATFTASPTPALTKTPTPTATATPIGTCGNGMVDAGEQCDATAPAGGGALCDPSQCVPVGATTDEAFACTCATGQLRAQYSPKGRLDNGWNGTSHNTSTVDPSDFDALLFDCNGTSDPNCSLVGPRPGQWGFRCELNARMSCTKDADCAPLNGRCGHFLGATPDLLGWRPGLRDELLHAPGHRYDQRHDRRDREQHLPALARAPLDGGERPVSILQLHGDRLLEHDRRRRDVYRRGGGRPVLHDPGTQHLRPDVARLSARQRRQHLGRRPRHPLPPDDDGDQHEDRDGALHRARLHAVRLRLRYLRRRDGPEWALRERCRLPGWRCVRRSAVHRRHE
jgi:hypothetical protein